MKIKHLLTISLVVLLSACDQPSNSVPIQASDSSYSDEYQNTPITTTDALAVGAVGVATGYALAKQANKPRYSKPNTSYGKPVVVVSKQTKPRVRALRYKRK